MQGLHRRSGASLAKPGAEINFGKLVTQADGH